MSQAWKVHAKAAELALSRGDPGLARRELSLAIAAASRLQLPAKIRQRPRPEDADDDEVRALNLQTKPGFTSHTYFPHFPRLGKLTSDLGEMYFPSFSIFHLTCETSNLGERGGFES